MPTVCEVQPHLAKKGSVANSVLYSEVDKPTMDSEKGSQKSSNPSNSVHFDTNETEKSNLTNRDNLEMIDIDSLFDEDTDDRPVLSEEEAWELFA